MEIPGICRICGRPGKMHTCKMCGSSVCSRCYDAQKGICQLCRRGLKFK
ncbi:MAG TPA: orotate phosphoribosyltransferase [Methanobacteriaceae archaeon]|nr:orotate phosphoribosyltransferase [Methanobacteriaceae archaeon]